MTNLGCLLNGHVSANDRGRAIDNRLMHYECKYCLQPLTVVTEKGRLVWRSLSDVDLVDDKPWQSPYT